MVFLFVLITFEPILDDFLRFWKNPEIQDGGPRWLPFRSDYVLLRHETSSAHDAEVKGDTFSRTIYPPSLAVIAFIFSELRRGREGGGGGGGRNPRSLKLAKSPG